MDFPKIPAFDFAMMDFPLLNAFFHVYMGTIIMIILIQFGVFDGVATELGMDHYAEHPTWLLNKLVPWFRMPANTLVNLGYVFVGFYWMCKIHMAEHKLPLSNEAEYMFYVFAMMSLWYGNIQCARIVTQSQRAAALDQWYTLPMFSWVPVFNLYMLGGFQGQEFLVIVVTSISSFSLAIFFRRGFELALACHILFAVSSSVKVLHIFPIPEAYKAFWSAVAMCAGFVILKLLDHRLATIHPLFKMLSGHFWSKICDFLQIHFVFEFFYSILQSSVQIHLTSRVS